MSTNLDPRNVTIGEAAPAEPRTATEITATSVDYDLTIRDLQSAWTDTVQQAMALCSALGAVYGPDGLPQTAAPAIDWGDGVLYDRARIWAEQRELVDAGLLRPELALATYGDNKLPGLPSFTAEDLDALVDLVLEKGFLLPALDCGACGEADCTAMTQRIVAGEKTPGDCVAARGSIEVTVNGQSVGLNPFTAQMLSGGIKGMLGALKGMVPGGEVIIRMKG